MNPLILLLTLLCSLASSARLRQGADKPALLARLLDSYLLADDRRRLVQEMELDHIFFTDNDLLPAADTWENLSLVLRTRKQGWIRNFIDYDSGPLKMRKLYSSPPEALFDTQIYGELYSGRMLYYSLGLSVYNSKRIINPNVWLKFMYKAVRGRNTDAEQHVITQIMNEHDDVQAAVCILIDDTLHMWRRGAGAFLVIGTLGQGTSETVIFPKRHHNVSFGTPCELTYSTAKLRANDVVFFVQTRGTEGNRKIASSADFVELCQNQSKHPRKLKKLIEDLFNEKHEQHGRFRLDAFHVQKNRR